MDDPAFLGRGWSFPPAFNWNDFNVDMVEAKEDIDQSLFLLLSTLPGERLMRPEFGCDLKGVVFAKRNSETEHRIIDLVSTAIVENEPRIIVEEIRIESREGSPEGELYILVEYRIIRTNTRSNIVYPFYLLEGTMITDV